MCSKDLAKKMVKSAELNNSKGEMDKIAKEKWKEINETANGLNGNIF